MSGCLEMQIKVFQHDSSFPLLFQLCERCLWVAAYFVTGGLCFLQDPNVNNIVAATTFFSQAGATLCLVLYLALATYADIPALIFAS
jgi:hypothetical protein